MSVATLENTHEAFKAMEKRIVDASRKLREAPDFTLRPAEDSDLNYVRKTWLQEHAQQSTWIDEVGGGETYFREHARCRDEALDRGGVIIACRPVVPSGICGFAVTELGTNGEAIIHFVYVKERWRRLGVAALLLEPFMGKRAIYTHRTKMCSLLPLPESWTFNPYPFLRTQ